MLTSHGMCWNVHINTTRRLFVQVAHLLPIGSPPTRLAPLSTVVAEETFRKPRDALRTFTLSSHQHSNKQASQQNQHNANKHILHIRCGLW